MTPLPRLGDDAAVLADHRRHQSRRGLASTSIRTRDAMLRAFSRWLGDRGILEATKADVETFLDTRGLKPNSRYAWLSHLHCFYTWAGDEDLIVKIPTRGIARPKVRRALPRPIADDDLAVALARAWPEMRAMLSLGAYQGLRCKEIANLSRDDIFEDRSPPVLVVKDGKGGHQRIIPIHPDTLAALRALPMPKSGWIFQLDRAESTPGSRHHYDAAHEVSLAIVAYFGRLGIPASAHQLRHWFGTTCYKNSRDLRMVQELMGHASPVTTAVYTQWSPEAAATAVTALRVDGLGAAAAQVEEFRAAGKSTVTGR